MKRFWAEFISSLYSIKDGIIKKKQEDEAEKEELRNQIAELEENQVPELDVTIYDFLKAFYTEAPVGIAPNGHDDIIWSFKEHYLKDLRNVPIGSYLWEEPPYQNGYPTITTRTQLINSSYSDSENNIDFIESIKNDNVGGVPGAEIGTIDINGETYYMMSTD